MRRTFILLASLCLLSGCAHNIRVATFDASLTRSRPGQLLLDLSTNSDPQIKNIAEIIQRTHPDILLINGIDYDEFDRARYLFEKNYLGVSQNGAPPFHYKYDFNGPTNAGVASGYDLDHDGHAVTTPGTKDYAADAIGYGEFPGKRGMILFSKYPIDTEHVRTFTRFRWNAMPGPMLPTDPAGHPWYTPDELKVLRLCSRSLWDVPIQIDSHTLHILASQPSSPLEEGALNRVIRRNHDELRLISDYITGGSQCSYLQDDADGPGRSTDSFPFVIVGDMGVDPLDGANIPGAMDQLLKHPRVNSSFVPSSIGAANAAKAEGGNNAGHKTPAQYDTADLLDVGNGPGNLRCDYVLPSKDLIIKGGGVYWPTTMDAQEHLATTHPLATTQPLPAPAYNGQHRLVWLDLQF